MLRAPGRRDRRQVARQATMDPRDGIELRHEVKGPAFRYLDREVMRSLADYAARREQSRSLVAEAAVASFPSPDADERREAATAKLLDGLDRCLQRLERTSALPASALSHGPRSRPDPCGSAAVREKAQIKIGRTQSGRRGHFGKISISFARMSKFNKGPHGVQASVAQRTRFSLGGN